MKYLILLCFFVSAVMAEDKYTDKYDGVNITEIMENERMVQNFADCFREKGPCSPEAKEIKEHLEEALANGCAKCTDVQKSKAPEIAIWLIKTHPALWEEATQKYDPTGEYRKHYEAMAKERGIEIPTNNAQ